MKKYILIAASALALAACDNNDDNPDISSGAAIITATIGESTVSRASDSKWAAGDKIGILSTIRISESEEVEGTYIEKEGPYINVPYTTENGDGTFKGTPIFFYKPMTLTAYYPFTGEEKKLPGTNGVIDANTGPENQTEENRPKIDFLWDSKTGVDKKDFSAENPNVNFKFAHKMSKLTFKFQGSEPAYDDKGIMVSDGVDVRTMVSYRIEGLGIDGTFDTATGDCNLTADSERAGLTIEFEKEPIGKDEYGNYKYNYQSTREFPSLIVFPQTKPKDTDFILHITTDELEEGQPEQNYKCTLKFTDEGIKPGNHYNFTIKVTRRGLIVGELEIKPWEETEKFIIATIDGEEKFEEQPAENQN